jgi:hypothetical protein
MAVINEKEFEEVVIESLVENFEYSEKKAKEFVDAYGENIVEAMWDAFSNELEQLVIEDR